MHWQLLKHEFCTIYYVTFNSLNITEAKLIAALCIRTIHDKAITGILLYENEFCVGK